MDRHEAPEAPAPAREDRWAALRWWFHVLVELAVLHGVVVAAETWLFGGSLGSYRAHPHPYWLVVIPMASARGMAAGLASALVSSGLYLVGAMHARPAASLEELLCLESMMEPVLFFGVGYLVGEFRDLVAKRIRDLELELDRSRAFGDGVRRQRDVLDEANRELQKRVVDHATQFGNLVAAARRVETASRPELLEIALELVEEHCGGQGSVLVSLADGSVDYLAHRGWPDREAPDRLRQARASEFVRRALEEGVEANGFALDETPPESGPIAVCPLVGAGGIVDALLCLDDVAPSRLNAMTVRTFFAIGRWVSIALARIPARPGDAPARPTAPGEKTVAEDLLATLAEPPRPEPLEHWTGTPEELGRDLVVEYDRTRRYGLPLGILTIQMAELRERDPESLERAEEYVRTTFTPRTRASDGLYRFSHAGAWVMLCPGTPAEGAEALRGRLERRLPRNRCPFGEVAIHATAPDPDTPDAPGLLDRLVERFHAAGAMALSGERPDILPARPRVGGLADGVRRLHVEASLAVRHDHPLQVVELVADGPEDVDPGLLAIHVDRALEGTIRQSDTAFAVGAGHVAVLLPHTGPEEAGGIVRRIVGVLAARDPEPAYGELRTRVISLGGETRDARALIDRLAESGPLREVVAGRAEA